MHESKAWEAVRNGNWQRFLTAEDRMFPTHHFGHTNYRSLSACTVDWQMREVMHDLILWVCFKFYPTAGVAEIARIRPEQESRPNGLTQNRVCSRLLDNRNHRHEACPRFRALTISV